MPIKKISSDKPKAKSISKSGKVSSVDELVIQKKTKVPDEPVKISKEELEEEKRQKTIDKLLSEEKINIAFSDPAHLATKHTIYTQDNKSVPQIESDSVHLAVTSPPYFNAREYSTWNTLNDYLADMEKSF